MDEVMRLGVTLTRKVRLLGPRQIIRQISDDAGRDAGESGDEKRL